MVATKGERVGRKKVSGREDVESVMVNVRLGADVVERLKAVASALGYDLSGLIRTRLIAMLPELEEMARQVRGGKGGAK
jgi:hypothetical protein